MATGPIVLVGEHTSLPFEYARLARLLGELSGAPVRAATLTPLDWLLGRIRGYGQLVFQVATAVDQALLESESKKAVLVGHGMGGLLCRIYIGGDPPYGGRRYSGYRRVSHLITLGTPHLADEGRGHVLIQQTNALFPGALHAGSGIRYLSVAGAAADGARSSSARRRYEHLLKDGRVRGDGTVPVESAVLPGSERVVLDSASHGPRSRSWYGADRTTVERWWPQEPRQRRSCG